MKRLKNVYKISEDYVSNKLDIEVELHNLLHPYVLDNKNELWQADKFDLAGFQAVRQKDGIYARFDENGKFVSHNYENVDDIADTVIVRELSSYEAIELAKLKDGDVYFFKNPPIFKDTSEEEEEPEWMVGMQASIDEFYAEMKENEKLKYTNMQIGEYLDKIIAFIEKSSLNYFDSDMLDYVPDDEQMEKFGFIREELVNTMGDLIQQARNEGTMESNPCSVFSEEGFSMEHKGKTIQLTETCGQGCFHRLEILCSN